MTSSPFRQPLTSALNIDGQDRFDLAFLRRILQAIDVRLKPLQEQQASVDETLAGLQGITLDRINNVLTPAIEQVFTLTERGFLIAQSSTEVALGVGDILVFEIDDDVERELFTPSPFTALTRAGSTDDYAIARTISYDKVGGKYRCEVLSLAGSAGPHSDWVIGALAGSTVAQYALFEEVKVVRDAAIAARNAASGHADTASDAADGAGQSAGAAAGSADAASDAAASALNYANAAAAYAPFSGRVAAEAAIIPVPVIRISVASPFGGVLSYKEDPAGPGSTSNALITGDGRAWCPDGVGYPDHFAENVNPGTTEMSAAIQAAHLFDPIIRLKNTAYLAGDTVDLSSLQIQGEGPLSRIILGADDRALFSLNTDGATYNRPWMDMVRLSCATSSTKAASCAILFDGDSSLVQRGTFADTFIDGFYAGVKSTKATRVTAFGGEGAVNHMNFSGIHMSNVFYGYWFTTGSGTGNSWLGNKISVRNGGSVFRFGGGVVGDIIISGLFPNSPSSGAGTFFSMDAGTEYNANISITACQMDGNIDTVFDVDAGTILRGLTYVGNNMGASAVLNAPVTRDSVIHDDLASDWLVGRYDHSLASGANIITAFRIKLNASRGAQLTVNTTGVLQGTGTCATEAKFLLVENGGAVDAVRVEQSQINSSSPTITVTAHSATELDVEISYSAASEGSILSTTARLTGGEFTVERI
jgi:hypothetical protein